MKKGIIVKKDNIFIKCINFIKNIFWKNTEKKDVVTISENNINKKRSFTKELRQVTEELELINEINNNPLQLYNMSMDELDNVHKAIKKRREFINQRILELKQEIAKKGGNI